MARNLVSGHGLLSNAVWSYATPPLVAPKPAFELWLPMATFISALPMALFGTGFASAQAGSVVVGAIIAPLTWAVGREAARATRLDERRTTAVALASGAVAAVLGSFVIAAVGPDSTTPFLVLAARRRRLLMPRALSGAVSARTVRRATQRPGATGHAGSGSAGRRAGDAPRRCPAASSLPGLAARGDARPTYLARQEAIWLAVAFVVMVGMRTAPR